MLPLDLAEASLARCALISRAGGDRYSNSNSNSNDSLKGRAHLGPRGGQLGNYLEIYRRQTLSSGTSVGEFKSFVSQTDKGAAGATRVQPSDPGEALLRK